MTRQHTPHQRFAHCPDCGKIAANTKAEARMIRADIATHNGNQNPVRYYVCTAGFWHWTSQQQAPKRPSTHGPQHEREPDPNPTTQYPYGTDNWKDEA